MTLCDNYPFHLTKAYTMLLYKQSFFGLYKMDAFGLNFIQLDKLMVSHFLILKF